MTLAQPSPRLLGGIGVFASQRVKRETAERIRRADEVIESLVATASLSDLIADVAQHFDHLRNGVASFSGHPLQLTFAPPRRAFPERGGEPMDIHASKTSARPTAARVLEATSGLGPEAWWRRSGRSGTGPAARLDQDRSTGTTGGSGRSSSSPTAAHMRSRYTRSFEACRQVVRRRVPSSRGLGRDPTPVQPGGMLGGRQIGVCGRAGGEQQCVQEDQEREPDDEQPREPVADAAATTKPKGVVPELSIRQVCHFQTMSP
jgi:hypothetical protein